MTNSDIIYKYFPGLSEKQHEQIDALGELYKYHNSRVNVVSRKDIDNLYTNHVLHSLAISAFLKKLSADTSFLDVGTGGGFPGIPLAIFYPDCHFHLVDRIGKKIKVATEISDSIGLNNVTFQHGDIGECRTRFNYVVSRAVMPLNKLLGLIKKNVSRDNIPENKYHNGLICLKGGDITEESKGIREPIVTYPVAEFVPESHFDEKLVVYIPLA